MVTLTTWTTSVISRMTKTHTLAYLNTSSNFKRPESTTSSFWYKNFEFDKTIPIISLRVKVPPKFDFILTIAFHFIKSK